MKYILSFILSICVLFFGGCGIYSAVTKTPYKDVITFKTNTQQEEVQEPTEEENQIETENAVIKFNI